MRTHRYFLPVEHDLDPAAGAGDVVCPAGQQRYNVFVQLLHVELGQVRLEGHAGEVIAVKVFDPGVGRLGHVVLPGLCGQQNIEEEYGQDGRDSYGSVKAQHGSNILMIWPGSYIWAWIHLNAVTLQHYTTYN